MHDKVHTAWEFTVAVRKDVAMIQSGDVFGDGPHLKNKPTIAGRRHRMSDVLYGGEDPEDWVPENAGVASDPLTLEEMDERWIQFYSDRIQAQIGTMLADGES